MVFNFRHIFSMHSQIYSKKVNLKKLHGFQLLEILVSLAILGILASFALPHYNAYLTKAKRLQAAKVLTQAAIALESYQLTHNSYAGATLEELHMASLVVDNQYTLAIQNNTGSDYLLVITPQGRQAIEDAACGALTLKADGEKGVTGPEGAESCW